MNKIKYFDLQKYASTDVKYAQVSQMPLDRLSDFIQQEGWKLVKKTDAEEIYKDEYLNRLIEVQFSKSFTNKDDPQSGFSFPSDRQGRLKPGNEDQVKSIRYIHEHAEKFNEPVINAEIFKTKLCDCGSGEIVQPVYDAKGIFVTHVCPKCRKDKLSKYRKEIFYNTDYSTTEEENSSYEQ